MSKSVCKIYIEDILQSNIYRITSIRCSDVFIFVTFLKFFGRQLFRKHEDIDQIEELT